MSASKITVCVAEITHFSTDLTNCSVAQFVSLLLDPALQVLYLLLKRLDGALRAGCSGS